MSSERECEAIVVIEDELEEGEISDQALQSVPNIRREVNKEIPRRYRLGSSSLKTHHYKSGNQSLFRKTRSILARASKHRPGKYVCRTHRALTLYKKGQKNSPFTNHPPSCRQTEMEDYSNGDINGKVSSDYNNTNNRATSDHLMQFGHQSSCIRDNDKRRDKMRTSYSKYIKSCYSSAERSKDIRKPENENVEMIADMNWRLPMSNGYGSYNSYASVCDEIDINVSYEELLEKYKSIQSELRSLEQEDSHKGENHTQSSSSAVRTRKHSPDMFIPCKKKKADDDDGHEENTSSQSKNGTSETVLEVEESAANSNSAKLDEDSELIELRRQALASCARSRSKTSSLTGEHAFANKENLPSSVLGKFSAAYSVSECNDNYEILDMDEGTSDDDALEKNHCPIVSNCQQTPINEDEEAEYLRAQLLADMNRRKSFNHSSEVEVRHSVSDDINSTVATCDSIPNFNRKVPIESPVSVVSHIPTAVKVTPVLNKAVVSSIVLQEKNASNRNETTYQNFYSMKHGSLVPYQKQAPLVITLQGDTSDSSDTDSDSEEVDKGKKAAIASLERLIDSAKNEATTKPTISVTSGVVEYLPETQQEEYIKLKEIIAQKEVKKEESVTNYSASLDAYTLIINKLKIAESMIITENKILKMVKTRSNEKKGAFITSQVEVRRLQEQLDAAVKVKDVNQRLMFDANAQLHKVQTSVAKRDVLIRELQRQCAKLGKQLFGDKFSCDDAISGRGQVVA